MKLPKPPGSGLPKPPGAADPAPAVTPAPTLAPEAAAANPPEPAPAAPKPRYSVKAPPPPAAAAPAPAAPRVARKPFKLDRRFLYGALAVVVVLAVAVFVQAKVRKAGLIPSENELLEAAGRQLIRRDDGRRLVSAKAVNIRAEDNSARFDLALRTEQTEPLFAEVDALPALREAGFTPEAQTRLETLRSRTSGLGEAGDAAVLALPRLIRQTVARGTTINYKASGQSARANDGPAHLASLDEIVPLTPVPEGRIRAAYPADALDAGDPSTAERLRQLVADTPALLARAEAAVAAAEQRQIEQRAARLAVFAEGALFTGTATRLNDQSVHALAFQIVKRDESRRRIEVLLRNDGGWSIARRFTGEYQLPDKPGEPATLQLTTGSGQALPGTGPFLEWNEGWTFTLRLEGGAWETKAGNWAYKFTRATDAARESEIARWAEDETKLRALFPPGGCLVLENTIQSESFVEQLVLSVTKSDADGLPVDALLASKNGLWKRKVRLQLITHRHANEGRPLRFILNARDNVGKFDNLRILGINDDMNWRFSFDGEALTWAGFYAYSRALTLRPVAKSTVDAWREEARQNAEAVTRLITPKAVFKGSTLSRDGSYSSRVTLAIRRVTPSGPLYEVTAVITSDEDPRIRRGLRGMLDPYGASLSFQATQEGTLQSGGRLQEWWFKSDGKWSFDFEVGPEGTLKGKAEQNWTLDLSATDTATTAHTPAGQMPADPAQAPPLLIDALPSRSGGYVNTGSGWQSLPVFTRSFRPVRAAPTPGMTLGTPIPVGIFTFNAPPALLSGLIRINGESLIGPAKPLTLRSSELQGFAVRGRLKNIAPPYRGQHAKALLARVDEVETGLWAATAVMKLGESTISVAENYTTDATFAEPAENVLTVQPAPLPLPPGIYVLATADDAYLIILTP